MTTTVAMVQSPPGGTVVGPFVLLLILVLLIVGLVFAVRFLLIRIHKSASPLTGTASPDGTGRRRTGKSRGSTEQSASLRVLTGRDLKRRYLAGKISRAQYDEQLRRLQVEEFLEGEK